MSEDPPDRRSRIEALRVRERVLGAILSEVRRELRRAEEGLPSGVWRDEDWYPLWAGPRMDLGAALADEHANSRAVRHIADAIALLSNGAWEEGLEQALYIATLELGPGVVPRSQRDAFLAAAEAAAVAAAERAAVVAAVAATVGTDATAKKKAKDKAKREVKKEVRAKLARLVAGEAFVPGREGQRKRALAALSKAISVGKKTRKER